MSYYNTKWLLSSIEQGTRFEYLFFWGHSNPKNEPVGKFLFSQWYPLGFNVDGSHYPTAEHWMMAEKARLFGDLDTLEHILEAKTPSEAKNLGRIVRGFDSVIWEQKCFEIVVQGNLQKFKKHSEAHSYLDMTGSKVIVEASPVDAFWGIGHSQESPEAKDPKRWRGKNLLGFALMEVRDRLRSDSAR